MLRLRPLGGAPFFVRPRTTDVGVLWEALVRDRGRPPPEVRSPAAIIDLGANIGATMAWAAAHFPSARIIGVELDACNAALCRRNVSAWRTRCDVVEAAVWSTEGTVRYVRQRRREVGSRLAGVDAASRWTHEASAISLNRLWRDFRLEWVDYVKMDIEGAEFEVLTSSTEWAQRVGCIKVELHPEYGRADCAKALAALGFSVRVSPGSEVRPVLIASRVR
jgi:FkbM family methyltransferase